MYKLCKTEQSARRQRMLEERLLHVMNVKRYEEINISDLCEQSGIPRKAFYRYFSGKEGALYALLDHTLLEFEKATGFLSGNGFRSPDLNAVFAFWYDQRQLLDVLAKSNLMDVLVGRAVSLAQTEYGVLNHMMPKEFQNVKHYGVTFVICGLLSMVSQWHHMGFQESVGEMAATAAVMLTRPLIQGHGEHC